MSKLDEILIQFDGTPYTKRVNQRAKQELLDYIQSQEWYYHDPDELGEDAFKQITEDEVGEL